MKNHQSSIKRTYLITGATKGIGYATALRLNQMGYHVVGIARHPAENNFPGDIFLADLSDAIATEKILQTIMQQYTLDGLINNVGNNIPAPLGKIKLEDLQTLLDLNLRTALQMTQIILPGMLSRQFGRIVNIAARAALGNANNSAYAASKAALIAFTRTWALELAKSGITVNAVAPGPIATERFRQHIPAGSEIEKGILQSIPMNRCGEMKEVAAAIAFFMGEDASFITGQTLFVDGGGSVGKQLL